MDSKKKSMSNQARFGTKAETLSRMEGNIKTAYILPQVRFTTEEWDASGCSLDVIAPRPD